MDKAKAPDNLPVPVTWPVAMWPFWTYRPAWWTWVIPYICCFRIDCTNLPFKGKWPHCGVGFTWDDGTERYGEALVGEGVVWNRPFSRLQEFARKPGNRVCRCVLTRAPESCRRGYEKMLTFKDDTPYYTWQLVQMWAAERFGFQVPRTPHKVVCSEYKAAVCLAAGYDLRDARRTRVDAVTPSSGMAACSAKYRAKFEMVTAEVANR